MILHQNHTYFTKIVMQDFHTNFKTIDVLTSAYDMEYTLILEVNLKLFQKQYINLIKSFSNI